MLVNVRIHNSCLFNLLFFSCLLNLYLIKFFRVAVVFNTSQNHPTNVRIYFKNLTFFYKKRSGFFKIAVTLGFKVYFGFGVHDVDN